MRPALRRRLGTTRRRAWTLARDVLGRARRNPASASVVPRPRRLGDGRALQLTHVLIACDLNPRYLDFWPLVRRAWPSVAGLEPHLVLVADPADVPDGLRDDPAVHVFPPVPEVHTAFQAQCIRLLYPGLLELDGGVLTSDADMVPLNRRYFHRPVSRIRADHFVAYRDVLLPDEQVPICYNAALPSTWRAVSGIDSLEGVRARLVEWSAAVRYSGIRGQDDWATDQQLLYRLLLDYGRRTRTVWILDDHFTGFRRLERGGPSKERRFADGDLGRIRRGAYSDFHCLVPYEEFRELNDLAVELAAEAAGRLIPKWRAGRGRP